MKTKIIFIAFILMISSIDCESIRAYHLDCGRKYFTKDEIKNLINVLQENHYNYLELAIGNDGMRFLLDDMTIKTKKAEYESKIVSKGIHKGNQKYYDAGEQNELTEKEMDELIEYAKEKEINILPLVNTPGHMDSILNAANEALGIDCSYKGSKRTIDITKEEVVSFTQALVAKYVDYFAKKGCKYFNLGGDEYANDIFTTGGMGFGNLVTTGKYVYFIKYINELAQVVKDAKMIPVMFNDGIYYGGIKSAKIDDKEYTIDKEIVASYWSNGWGEYKLSPASVLIQSGFKILNTNGNWYYILGRTLNENTLKTIPYNNVINLGKAEVLGSMVCFWCDNPTIAFDEKETSNMFKQASIFAKANPGEFK